MGAALHRSNNIHKQLGKKDRTLVNVVKKYFHKGSNYISRLISSDNNSSEKLGNIFTHFHGVIFFILAAAGGTEGRSVVAAVLI